MIKLIFFFKLILNFYFYRVKSFFFFAIDENDRQFIEEKKNEDFLK